MTKRMQVLFDDAEYARILRLARRHGLTLAQWVRDALRAASRDEAQGSVERKLAALDAAVRHSYPTADIERMLDEIEGGYVGEEQR
jgi:hypothetical protein